MRQKEMAQHTWTRLVTVAVGLLVIGDKYESLIGLAIVFGVFLTIHLCAPGE